MTEHRVKFDFVVHFTNGGSLSAQDFRLDIPGNDISDDELAAYLIRDMNLLMAGRVDIANKQIVIEPHKRTAVRTTVLLRLTATFNLVLAFAHQVDAAYWREWEMFGLPGGVQLFNLLNILLFGGLLALLANLIQGKPSATASSLAIAGVCALILPIHAGFALAGYPQFDLPVSIALMIGTFLLSVVQVIVTLGLRSRIRDARQ
ncbi:hypothetical protein QAA18_11985 [Luteimonas sp. 8-5]|uniref:DUF6713 family protein n=1 Tax=Luteimonas sp. 8-5 TaxID=3039387 RepID=UPI00243684D5|nr:DUF6713 family protein [Luteimonas sp. 8-5]MDG6349445.1 hypothetical protein [Luteimonas sp. 8-5]